jgi:hypothetical protein
MPRMRRVMRRRAIARTAVVGGIAYSAGKHAAANAQAEPVPEEQPAPPAPEPVADPIEQLKQLNELREQGILTEEEFTAEKRKILG